MKNEKLEKQASSEIAQSRARFEKFAKDEFDDSLPFDWNEERGEYSMAHPTVEAMWRTYLAAERDTRERLYQLLQSEASLYEINGRECDASGNTIGGYGDVNAAIALKRMAERIRGKE